jgi:hypothetical protein
VVKSVNTRDLKSLGRKALPVQVRLRAPKADGLWRLLRAHRYDQERLSGASVALQSHLRIDKQVPPIALASGRFAILDGRLGFSLVPWRPVIEKRLGK